FGAAPSRPLCDNQTTGTRSVVASSRASNGTTSAGATQLVRRGLGSASGATSAGATQSLRRGGSAAATAARGTATSAVRRRSVPAATSCAACAAIAVCRAGCRGNPCSDGKGVVRFHGIQQEYGDVQRACSIPAALGVSAHGR